LKNIFYISVILSIASLCQAAPIDTPIKIFSDVLTYYPDRKEAVFEGDVDVYDQGNTLKADKIIVYFKPDKNSSSNHTSKIDKILAFGNVELTNPSERANSKRAEYRVDQGVVYLYDEVKLFKNNSTIEGDKLTYNNNTGETIVHSKTKQQRVKGVFVPEKK
jgi:lipopolysaccharide transport protein LptA